MARRRHLVPIRVPSLPPVETIGVPQNFTVTVLSAVTVQLSWNPVPGYLVLYEVFRSTDGVNFSLQISPGVTSIVDSASRGTTYYYKVRARGMDSTDTYSIFGDFSSIVVVSTPLNTDPVWQTIPDFNIQSTAPIGTVVVNAAAYASDADGDNLNITIENSVLPSGLSYVSGSVIVTGALAGGSSGSARFGADDGYGSALSDWQTRSTAAGVLWAHRFTGPTDGSLYWSQRSLNPASPCRFGYLSAAAPQTGTNGTRAIDGIIPGTGCLEMFIPGGLGIPINGSWARPLAPVTADPSPGSGLLPYTADINAPNLQYLPFKDFQPGGNPANKMGAACGGFFTHSDYYTSQQRSYNTTSGTFQEIISNPAKDTECKYPQ